MRISKKILACVLAALMAISMMPFTALADGDVAVIGETGYATLDDAIAACPDNAETATTIKLLADVTTTATTVINNGKNIKFNLNSKSITSANVDPMFLIEGGKLETTSNKGTIESTTNDCTVFRVVGKKDADAEYSKLVIGASTTVEGKEYGILIPQSNHYADGVYVQIRGKIETGLACIYTNGNINQHGSHPATILVSGSSSKLTCTDNKDNSYHDNAAVYAAGYAVWTFSSGSVTGPTALYAKCGTFTCTGTSFNGTGDAVAYSHNGNGITATGEAIVLENCAGYSDELNFSITKGTVSSANADPFGSYAYSTGTDTREAETGFVGLYSTGIGPTCKSNGVAADVSEFYNADLAAKYASGDTYVETSELGGTEGLIRGEAPGAKVVRGDTVLYAGNVVGAANYCQPGETVYALKNFSTTSQVQIFGQDVTIDLQGYTYADNSKAYPIRVMDDASVTFTNGTVTCAKGLTVETDSKLVIDEDCTVNANIDNYNLTGVQNSTVEIYGTVNGSVTTSKTGSVANVYEGAEINNASGTAINAKAGTTINVYGGEVNGAVTETGTGEVNISGGTFDADVTDYVVEGAAQDPETGVVIQEYVAKIGSTLYATLEEAAEAATAGQTITLIADVDLTAYARNAAHKINLSGTVLDLNGHTISNKNKGVVFVGDNFTVKNGNMVCVNDPSFTKYKPDNSYGIMIWPEDGDDVHDTVADPSENVVLENLNVTGGINCFGSNVTIKGENTNVAGTAFYAVWANAYTTIDIEDGTFTTTANETTSTIGAGVETGKGAINVKGGNFTVASGKVLVHDNSSKDRVVISGGFYHNANGSVYEVLPANLAADHTQDTTSGEVIPAAVDTMSITVEDDIDLNIYLDDSDASETYNRIKTIKYTYNITPDLEEENMETFTVPATRDANDKVVLKIELAPAQIRDDITVVAITEAGETVRNFTTSIADYCNTIINGNYPANLKDLAKSTLDYGKGTSSYFGYNTTAYSSYSIQLDDPTAEITALAQAAEANTIDTDKFTITGVSYRATSKPEIRFYIDPTTISEDLLAGYNETIVSTIGTAYFAKHDDDYLLIVKDIDIVDFNKQFVVTVKDSHDELYDWDVVHFTPITWVYAALKSTDTPLKSLAKTIGNYYLKSANYFGV